MLGVISYEDSVTLKNLIKGDVYGIFTTYPCGCIKETIAIGEYYEGVPPSFKFEADCSTKDVTVRIRNYGLIPIEEKIKPNTHTIFLRRKNLLLE